MTTGLAVIPQSMRNLMVSLPESARQTLLQTWAPVADQFGGGYNRISINGLQFSLSVSGDITPVGSDVMNVVIIRTATTPHCSWYASSYDPQSEESGPPDAVWAYGSNPPSNVPASALQRDARKKLGYSISMRAAVALVKHDASGTPYIDTDELYLFNINAMSLFGKSKTTASGQVLSPFGMYLNTLQKSYNTLPCAVVTQIIMDRSMGVPMVRFTVAANNNQPIMLDEATLVNKIIPAMESTEALSIVDWAGGSTSAGGNTVQTAEATATVASPQVTQASPGVQQNAGASSQAPGVTSQQNAQASAGAQTVTEPAPAVNAASALSGLAQMTSETVATQATAQATVELTAANQSNSNDALANLAAMSAAVNSTPSEPAGSTTVNAADALAGLLNTNL